MEFRGGFLQVVGSCFGTTNKGGFEVCISLQVAIYCKLKFGGYKIKRFEGSEYLHTNNFSVSTDIAI